MDSAVDDCVSATEAVVDCVTLTGSTTVPLLDIELSFCADEAPESDNDPETALKSWHPEVKVIAIH